MPSCVSIAVERDVLAEEAVGAAGVERGRDRLPPQRGRASGDREQRRAGAPRRRARRPVDVRRVGDEVARPAGRDPERPGVAEREVDRAVAAHRDAGDRARAAAALRAGSRRRWRARDRASRTCPSGRPRRSRRRPTPCRCRAAARRSAPRRSWPAHRRRRSGCRAGRRRRARRGRRASPACRAGGRASAAAARSGRRRAAGRRACARCAGARATTPSARRPSPAARPPRPERHARRGERPRAATAMRRTHASAHHDASA